MSLQMMNDHHAPSSSPAQSGGGVNQDCGGGGGGGGAQGLKMTISLKQKTPFYLMRPDPTPVNETTGATNLMATRGLEHSYNKLTSRDALKKVAFIIEGRLQWPIHF